MNEEQSFDIAAVGQYLLDLVKEHGPGLLYAIAVLVIGLRIIKFLQKQVRKACQKSKLEPALQSFLTNLTGWGLKLILIIVVATMMGMETTSLIAVLGAAGLAIGLALQGTLANFAGGMLIILFKPFKIGDLVKMQDEKGFVKAIHIFNTIIETPDRKTVIIPNGAIMNGNITNYSENGIIRVDLVVGIAYEADIDESIKILTDVCSQVPQVLDVPPPFVDVVELGDSSVNLVVRPHCHPDDYWNVYMTILRKSKQALDSAGIGIPFPQRDVHIVSQPAG
ncbi:MAG: mechanosensitive ion channel [Flavobacteriales bacterium]|nr:mechanosensitive ion channel [Flavobacteriales bacterium]